MAGLGSIGLTMRQDKLIVDISKSNPFQQHIFHELIHRLILVGQNLLDPDVSSYSPLKQTELCDIIGHDKCHDIFYEGDGLHRIRIKIVHSYGRDCLFKEYHHSKTFSM